MSAGMPIVIKAPEGAESTYEDLGIVREMTVKAGEDYNLLIVATNTDQTDAKKLIAAEKETIEGSTYFSKIIEESENGFLYEKKIDEDYINYDFRVVKVRGENKYTYKAGLGNKYTLEAAKTMYKAVQ